MNRIEALAYLDGILAQAVDLAGREHNDSLQGYKPALDAAFSLHIARDGLGTGLTNTVVPAADEYGFQQLLIATALDLILPNISLEADISVDAPLTSIKTSQLFRQFQALRADAWARAGQYEYGLDDGAVGGFKVNLDFREPGLHREYG
jgi:hypothetical protein